MKLESATVKDLDWLFLRQSVESKLFQKFFTYIITMHASIKYVYIICLLRPKHELCSNFHKVKDVDTQ